MANIIFNRAKGRWAEWAERVNANDPTNSVIGISAIDTTGLEADSVLIDKDDHAAVVVGTTNEATNSGYARKSLDQAGGITITYDDTNDRVDVDYPDQTWTAVGAGNAWSKLLFWYDSDSTAGTDSAILPISLHDFAITPDGSDITATIAVAQRAS